MFAVQKVILPELFVRKLPFSAKVFSANCEVSIRVLQSQQPPKGEIFPTAAEKGRGGSERCGLVGTVGMGWGCPW